MNKTIIAGRLTKDPEVRTTQAGMAVARYSVAVDRPRKKDQESKADFFNCTAFGKNAEFVEKYLKKGTKMLIEGQMQQDSYTDKNGNKVTTWNLIVDHQEFCESKPKDEAPTPEQKAEWSQIDSLDSEELPFNF